MRPVYNLRRKGEDMETHDHGKSDRLLFCTGCGKLIGREKNGLVTIRHKGRTVSISLSSGEVGVAITCETCGTVTHFVDTPHE